MSIYQKMANHLLRLVDNTPSVVYDAPTQTNRRTQVATLHFVIPEDLKTELVEEAKRENRSVTATTLMAIRQYLTALDREREPKDTA